MLKKNVSLLSNLLLLLGFLLTALFCYSHFIDGDVIQILAKAHIYVTKDILIPYGNESLSGARGNIPGSFLTWASGFPMKLWFSPWAALGFLAFLHFLAFLMYRNVLKNFISSTGLIFLVILFWLNPWRLSEVFLWNPAYVFFVSLFHMWSAFYLSKNKSFIFSVLHGLSLFLGLQVHPSFIILFFMTMMLLWMRAMRPHWMGTIVGICLGLISLIPYILAGLKDPSVFPRPGSHEGTGFIFFGLVYVYPLLKGFWYWILFGSSVFQTHIFHQIHFQWLENVNLEWGAKVIWTVIKYTFGVFGVGLSFYVNFKFYKENRAKFNVFKYKMRNSKEWLVLYAITAFWSMMLATALAPTLPIYWHLLYVWPMTLIPLLVRANDFYQKVEWQERTKKYFVALAVYFVMTNFFAALGSKKHDINQPFHDLYFQACKETCSMENLKNSQ